MITLQPKSLNLLCGKIGSAKTPMLLNYADKSIKSGLNVLYITTDVDQFNIKKVLHCLHNGKNLIEIRYDKDEKTPLNLILPTNITVIDSVDTIDSFKKAFDDVNSIFKVDLIIVDSINFIKDESTKTYKERIDFVNSELNAFAKKNSIDIFGSLVMLGIDDTPAIDFMIKDMGKLFEIKKVGDTSYDLIEDNDVQSKNNYTLSMKDISLTSNKFSNTNNKFVDDEAYMGT